MEKVEFEMTNEEFVDVQRRSCRDKDFYHGGVV